MDYKEFLKRLEEKSGYDFTNYSSNSISRRLQKICTETGMSFEQILIKVVSDKDFVKRIVEDITVNTTELFRDPSVWVTLSQQLYQRLPRQVNFTIWHIGCSSGLEVYSDLVMLNELGIIDRARVYGTDINPTILEAARKGVYNYSYNRAYVESFDEVMKGCGFNATFDKYFEIDEKADVIRVKPFLLDKPKFLLQDLVRDKAPFPFKVDAVFLRNVMIYFNDQLQHSILGNVLEQMRPQATLVMGKQETIPTSMGAEFVRVGAVYLRNKH